MKVEFYSETYGEPSKDFKLRGEANLKLYQVYMSDIVENGLEGAQIAAENTQNIFQTCSSLTQLFPPGTHTCSHGGSSHRLPGSAPLSLLPSPSSSRSPCKNPKRRCFIGKSSCKSEMTLFCPHSRLREFQVEERLPSELHSHCSIVWSDISLFFPLISHSKELSCAPHLLEHCTSAALASSCCTLNVSSFYLPTCFLFLEFSSPTPLVAVSLIRSELKCQLLERPSLSNADKLANTGWAKSVY